MALPRLLYYQLWHERTHGSSAARWLRELTKEIAASLRHTHNNITSTMETEP